MSDIIKKTRKPRSPNKPCCDKYDGETMTILMDHGKQYAKAVCAHCKHWIKWLPNPRITKECDERSEHIDKVLSKYSMEITPKRKAFFEAVKNTRFITPRQHIYYLTLLQQYQL